MSRDRRGNIGARPANKEHASRVYILPFDSMAIGCFYYSILHGRIALNTPVNTVSLSDGRGPGHAGE